MVENGEPRAAIVIPSKPAKAGKQPDFTKPAANLQDLLHRISGASLEVLTLQQWKQKSAGKPAIFLGCAPAESAVAAVENEEGSRVESRPAGLMFAVSAKAAPDVQQSAMEHAVNRFAQKVLGCRWLMPGELGEVLPARKTITVADVSLEENPPFWFRRMRDRQAAGHDERRTRALQAIDVSDRSAAEEGLGAGDWLQRMNMGSRFDFEFGHSYAGWWEKYGAEHPEFFARQPDGTRTQHPPRERLCESEPKLWDQVAANAIAAFTADPALRMYSICENDGGSNTFCMCPRCMAMDPPNAPIVKDAKTYDPKTGEPFPDGYPSLSDRVFTFFNEVARRVKAKYPDRLLGTYAYSCYRTVPVRVPALEDNIIVSLVSDDAAQVEAWSRLAPKMFVRPNTLWDGRCFGMARNDAHRLGALVQTAAQHHVLGMDWDGMIGNWATQGLNYYVVAQLMWDPSQTVDDVIADYLRAAYGEKAAPAMRRYYDELETLTDEAMKDEDYQGRKPSPAPLLEHYSAARLSALRQSVSEAHEATAPDSAERRRVELVQQGLLYTSNVCLMIEHLAGTEAGKADARKAFDAEWKTQAPYFAELSKNRYFGMTQNVTKLSPALKTIERKGKKPGQ